MHISQDEIHFALSSTGYCSNPRIDAALWAALLCDKPLLIEGDPGVGKTALAKALARGLGYKFIRVQMYEGLTDDKVLYDYDYQKQLLTLEAIKPKLEAEYEGKNLSETIDAVASSLDFYGEDFLIKRPVLRAITSEKPVVLLFDELDKASEEIEYMLYEFLEDYSITIPQYGEISSTAENRPLVFITSNNYRELSGALKRRCNYLYIDRKDEFEIYEILKARASVDDRVASGIAKCLSSMPSTLRQMPSISEAIDFAEFLSSAGTLSKQNVLDSLGILAKNSKDRKVVEKIVSENGEVLWNAAQ